MGWWLLACSVETPPELPAVVEEIPEPPTPGPWVLTGRAAPNVLISPTLWGVELGDCSELSQQLRTRNTGQCGMERWSNGVRTRFYGRVGTIGGEADAPEGPYRRVEAEWTSLGDLLHRCVVDLWALPPAGDPKGQRQLDDDAWHWRLSGENVCGLAGEIRLLLHSDRVEVGRLTVDGIPWSSGGRKRAQGRLWLALREVLLRDWKTFSGPEQQEIREALEAQPGDDAKALLRRLPQRSK